MLLEKVFCSLGCFRKTDGKLCLGQNPAVSVRTPAGRAGAFPGGWVSQVYFGGNWKILSPRRSTGAEDRPSPRQFVYKLRLPFMIDSVLSGNGGYHILRILPDFHI